MMLKDLIAMTMPVTNTFKTEIMKINTAINSKWNWTFFSAAANSSLFSCSEIVGQG